MEKQNKRTEVKGYFFAAEMINLWRFSKKERIASDFCDDKSTNFQTKFRTTL